MRTSRLFHIGMPTIASDVSRLDSHNLPTARDHILVEIGRFVQLPGAEKFRRHGARLRVESGDRRRRLEEHHCVREPPNDQQNESGERRRAHFLFLSKLAMCRGRRNTRERGREQRANICAAVVAA